MPSPRIVLFHNQLPPHLQMGSYAPLPLYLHFVQLHHEAPLSHIVAVAKSPFLWAVIIAQVSRSKLTTGFVTMCAQEVSK